MTELFVESAVTRYITQATLFAAHPSRINLLKVNLTNSPTDETTFVNVWRNHNFESLEPLIDAYAAFRSWPLSFRLGSYDDSFSFGGLQKASVELIWMDSNRLLSKINFSDWLAWLQQRLTFLRQKSSAPIILATWLIDEAQRDELRTSLEKLPAVYFADLYEESLAAGVNLLDERSAALAGTSISARAQVILARTLVCKWLSGSILPPIKAIALDLDNTLHAGVLGEDGFQNVVLTSEHKNLQLYVKALQKRGVFLALVSRNELVDVEALFKHREDYPLRIDDFSAVEVSWGAKADALKRIANKLRISSDAILFVDDNIGELAAVTQQLPSIQSLYADPNAELTMSAIEYYPGLWRWKQEVDDAKRIQDLRANATRDAIALNHSNPVEYLRSLQINLTFYWNAKSQLSRLSDLCRKTNQFNLAIRRLNESELFDRMSGQDTCVASVHLSDRLSDSGIIAVIVATRAGMHLKVEELCISCRAIGRHLENDIILHALKGMPIWAGCKTVEFLFQHGDRNKPALDWLSGLMQALSVSSSGSLFGAIAVDAIEKMPPLDGAVLKNGE